MIEDAASGTTLRQLAQNVRGAVTEHAPASAAELERKFLAAGYTGNEEAVDIAYKKTGVTFYRVAEGFPRVLRTDVPQEVDDVRYRLRTVALQGHAIGEKLALTFLGVE